MANRFWVGGTGTWNSTNTTNWSTTSGGAGGASVPATGDDVFFNASSGGGTCTLAFSTPTLLSLNFTGYTGTFTNSGTPSLNVNASLILGTGMTWSFTHIIRLVAGTATTLTTNGKTITGPILLRKTADVQVTLGSALTCTSATGIYTESGFYGKLNVATFTCTVSRLDMLAGGSLTALIFGSGGKIVISGAGQAGNGLVLNMPSGLTVSGTCNIELNNSTSGITATFESAVNGLVVNTLAVAGRTGVTLFNGTGPTTLNIGANAHNISNPGATRAINVAAGYTGTISGNGITPLPIDATGCTVTTNGVTIPALYCVAAVTNSNPIKLGGAVTVSGTVTLQNMNLELSNFTLTPGVFSVAATAATTLNFGSTGSIVLSGSTTSTPLSITDASNLTVSGTHSVVVTTPSSGQTKSIRTNANATYREAAALDITISTVGTGGTIYIFPQVRSLAIPAGTYSLTLDSGSAGGIFRVYGNYTINGAITGYTVGDLQFSSSGTQTVNTNGNTLQAGSVGWCMNTGADGTVQLLSNVTTSAFSISSTNFERGTLNLNGYTLTVPKLTTASSFNRTIAFGSAGKIVITGYLGSGYSEIFGAGFTSSGSKNIEANGSATTIDMSFGGPSSANALNFTIPAANTSTVNVSGDVNDFTINSTGGTVNINTTGVYGNFLVASSAVTPAASANTLTFKSTSGTKTITTNAKTIDQPITFDGVGGTWQLSDALTVGSSRTVTLTNGTFNTNNFTFTVGTFSSTASNTRAITFGSSSWVIQGSGTAMNIGGTGLTVNRNTGSLSFSSASAKTFSAGGYTWPTVIQSGGGALTFSGTGSTFANLTRTFAGACTVTFTSGQTFNFDTFTLSGVSAAARTTLNSTTTSQHTLSSSGTISVDFLAISYSNATNASWYAGTGSSNGGNNTGWIFTAPPAASGNMLMIFR